MQAVVGGNLRYPTLQSIADLFRVSINDTFNNAGGSGTGYGGGAGLVMPNSNPDLTTFIDAAVQEVFSDLRNVGDPELILDNFIVYGIPPLTQTDPAVQVSLGYAGYFDGFQWHFEWALPISLTRVLALWERQSTASAFGYGGGGSGEGGYGGISTNNQLVFIPMQQAPFGLSGVMQGQRMCQWEMRQGQIWMPGCLNMTDIRIRARITYPEFLNPATIDFSSAYVPILDCRNAVVSKMLIRYAMRFAPENYQMAVADEKRQMDKLSLEVVRQMQSQENQRSVFGQEATQDYAQFWSSL